MNERNDDPQQTFVEGEDYYFENGLMVFTARFLLKRGYCCNNGCRNCPYPKNEDHSKNSSNSL
jgi:hypothetical protein